MSKHFKTADGQEFYQENDAKNHAKTLVDKTVTPPSIGVEVEDIEVTEEVAVKFSKMTKKQLIEFAESKGIEVDEKATNAAIIVVIEDSLAVKEFEVIDLKIVSPIADEIGTKEVVINEGTPAVTEGEPIEKNQE